MAANLSKTPFQSQAPSMYKEFVLKTICAQNVWKKGQDSFNRRFSQFQTALAMMCTDEEYEKLEDALNNIIKTAEDSVDKALTTNLANGQKAKYIKVHYPNPLTVRAEYNSPAMLRFINTVIKLDELACLIDSLWLQGCYPSAERRRTIYAWQNYFKYMFISCKNLLNGGWNIVHARQKRRIQTETEQISNDNSLINNLTPPVEDEASQETLPTRVE